MEAKKNDAMNAAIRRAAGYAPSVPEKHATANQKMNTRIREAVGIRSGPDEGGASPGASRVPDANIGAGTGAEPPRPMTVSEAINRAIRQACGRWCP